MAFNSMLATRGSSTNVIHGLKDHCEKSIKIFCVISVLKAVYCIIQNHPKVNIYFTGLNNNLDEKGYIAPWLGDAGCRLL